MDLKVPQRAREIIFCTKEKESEMRYQRLSKKKTDLLEK